MKIEDAIQRQAFLKNTYTNCINGIDEHKGYYQKLVDSCDMAMSALEKQIPKPPTPETMDETTGAITESECPTCGTPAIQHEAAIYCHNCGQRLK